MILPARYQITARHAHHFLRTWATILNQDLVLDIGRASHQKVIMSPALLPSFTVSLTNWQLDSISLIVRKLSFFNKDETEIALRLDQLLSLVALLAAIFSLVAVAFNVIFIIIHYLALVSVLLF